MFSLFHKISSSYFILVFLIQSLLLNAQNLPNNTYFEHLGTKEGLSQNDVNCIYQDKQGFMWFGTHDGLNKYDGYNFTTYHPKSNDSTSISSNLIFALTGDKKGNLWIGTSGHGLNYFDRKTETFTHYLHDPTDSNSINNNYISDLLIDSKNRLWVITGEGLNVAQLNDDSKSLSFEKLKIESRLPTCIYKDKEETVWVGTTQGLYKIKNNNNTPSLEYCNLRYNTIKDINETKHGDLVIATNLHLNVYNSKSNTYKQSLVSQNLNNNYIDNLLVDDDVIWAGTAGGLYKFKINEPNQPVEYIDKFQYQPQENGSISKNIINALYKDKTGIIWIGTNGGGINKLDPQRKPFINVKNSLSPESLSYDKIRSIFEDSNGALWIGTEGGTLNMLPKKQDPNIFLGFEKFNSAKRTFAITEINKSGRKILLVGGQITPTLYQLDITDPDNIFKASILDVKTIITSVFSILEDSNKNLWIGTYQEGVHRWLYDENTNTYKKDILKYNERDNFSISNNIIRNIIEDKKGNIWFATGDGLCLLESNEVIAENPKFKIFKHDPNDENSISHNYILELFENSNNELWIGTFGGGINKYLSPTDSTSYKFLKYKESDGLPNNVIKGILEDNNGKLWISTNKGLSKFDPKNQTFKNYDASDGLQNNEFQELARLKRKNGQLIFGGTNGFNVFNPEDIKDNPIEAETIITGISISNKKIKVGDKLHGRILLKEPINQTKHLELKYSENSCSFEFAALHYSIPEKNNYMYMLEGFDKDWIHTNSKKRFATYTNLPPDTYTLKVKASNNDNIWDSTPATVKITIAPPYYLTNLAFLCYALLLIGLLLLYRRFTIIKTSKKHAFELDALEKEKSEELQRTKLEFFTNITHEFTTPLTLIKGPLKYLQKQGDKINNDTRQEQYKLMQKNTDYLMRLIAQLLDFRKINQGKMRLVMRKSDVVNFIKEVSEPFQFMANKQNISFNINTSKKKIETWFDHDAVEKITNNLLSNAFKFTPKNGSITIDISTLKDDLNNNEKPINLVKIQVKDTGLGMDQETLQNVFKRFFSEKNKKKKDAKGMGIGLAFTRDLTQLHRGSIDVNSTPNSGTTFTIKLPMDKSMYLNVPEITCKDVNESDFHLRSSESEALAISINDEIIDKELTETKAQNPILLLVDDNEDIRSFVQQALKDKYTIYTAENGEDALEVLSNISPKIIITDVMMPVMDGIALCKHIKNKKETSHIPVMMLTAKLSQENEILGLKTGADAYIRKPFDVELLELKISNIIKHREELRKKFNLDISLQPKEITVTSVDERFLNQAIEIVEKHMMNTDFNVEMLVKEMGFSRTNLYKKFKEITGLSSSEFIRNIRLKRAVQLFEQSDLSVKEIMYMTGFNTSSYFAKCFKKQFGVKPSEYVKQKNRSKLEDEK